MEIPREHRGRERAAGDVYARKRGPEHVDPREVARIPSHALELDALQRVKLKRVRWDACDLTRIDVFGTPLAGIDVSGCAFAAPVLSGDFHELRGAVVSVEQALDVARLLGVRIAEE